MGGAKTGGEDDDVSGNEAVITGGTTYSSKKTTTVNQQIADTNQENRDDRKSPLAKILSKTPLGSTLNKIKDSEFVKNNNYKRRVAFAKKTGKFTNTDLSRDLVLSEGFKTQLDGMGYSDEPGNVGGGGNDRPEDENQPLLNVSTQPVNNNVTTAPTNAEVTQAQSTEMSADQILLANKKKGRSTTILNSSQGLGGSTANTTKKTLGA